MTVVVLIKLILIDGITFTLYVSNQSDVIHRDYGFK